jgi:two-component system LytT family response regulator
MFTSTNKGNGKMRTLIPTVIVEDEEPSRNRLRRLLGNWGTEIEIIGEAADGPEAIKILSDLRPELIFLDIELPGVDGLTVLEKIPYQPAVIFTTAYHKYALDAFKAIAIDYLLKPIEEELLKKALMKLKKVGYRQSPTTDKLNFLTFSSQVSFHNKIPCKVGDRIDLIDPEKILIFQADNKYTVVKTIDREYVIDTPLFEIERKINPTMFVRIHRSTIVNIEWIADIHKWLDGRLKIHLRDANKTELIASRSYTSKLIDW